MVISIVCFVAVVALAWYVFVERPTIVAIDAGQRLHAALQLGDEVVTVEGVHGTIHRIDGARLLLAIGAEWLTVDASAIVGRSAHPAGAAHGGTTMRVLGGEFADAASRWFGQSGRQAASSG